MHEKFAALAIYRVRKTYIRTHWLLTNANYSDPLTGIETVLNCVTDFEILPGC